VDPDVIYSFAPLKDEQSVRIHREIYPAQLVIHNSERDEDERFAIHVQIRAKFLTSLSTLVGDLNSRSPISAPPRLFDVYLAGDTARSLRDSFGSYYESFGLYPFPPEWHHVASTVTLTTRAIADDPRLSPKPSGDIETELAAAWLALAKRNTVSLAECAAWRAPRLDFFSREWGQSFNLLVGDSVEDRALFWNSRQLMPEWTDRYVAAARVSPSDLDDPERLASIAEFLRWRNHIHAGSGGQGTVTLRSLSLSDAELTRYKDAIHKALHHVPVWTKLCKSLEAALPMREDLELARREGSALMFSPQWREFSWTGKVAHPPETEPRHILRTTGPSSLLAGCWAADLDMEMPENLSQYSNVQHTWLFSRRLRMANAFKCRFHDTSRSYIPLPKRINIAGLLSVFPGRGYELLSIEMPTNREAFVEALIADGMNEAVRGDTSYPAPPLATYRPSDKGRYLRGLLGLCGGLAETASFLLHGFWNEQLEHWGATTNAREADLARIEARLRKGWRDGVEGTEQDFARLSKVVAAEARNIQLPKNSIVFSEFDLRWGEHRAKFWATNDPPEKSPEEEAEWEEYERGTLENALQRLAVRDVVFQGFTAHCRNCHHRTWVPVSAIAKETICAVCAHREPVPVKIDWEFRLNEFVRDALKQHGLQSVIWCLANLRGKSRSSFYFEGQSDLWFRGSDLDAKRDAEFDLLAVADGVSYLCEVKSQKELLKPDEQRSLLDLASRIRPNVVIVAVMDAFKNKSALRAKLEPALRAMDVELELWGIEDRPLDDSPYLR
jgi:hypothetical protein